MGRAKKQIRRIGYAFCSERGIGLVETLVVIVILPLIFFAMFALFNTASLISNTNNTYAILNQNATQALRSIAREIAQTDPFGSSTHWELLTGSNSNSVIRFRIPVDYDCDSDVVGGSANSLEWGAYNQLGQTKASTCPAWDFNLPNRWVQYSVMDINSRRVLVRDVLTSAKVVIMSLRSVVVNNVSTVTSAFKVIRRDDGIVQIILIMRATDPVGQFGKARTFGDVTFRSETLPRMTSY